MTKDYYNYVLASVSLEYYSKCGTVVVDVHWTTEGSLINLKLPQKW